MSNRIVPLLLMFSVGACGCGSKAETPSQTVAPEPQQLSWEAQIDAVRDGQTTAIVFEGPVTTDQFQMLATGCAALKKLNCDVTGVAPQEFAVVLSQLPNLTQIVLRGTQGNAALEQVAKLTKLRILNLPEASVDDAGLAQISGHPVLELVRVESPQVTDRGLKSIAQIPNLRFLHLINTDITDAGLAVLYPLDGLESFYLDGSACTDDGLSALVKARPDLHFHWNQLHLPDDPFSHSHD